MKKISLIILCVFSFLWAENSYRFQNFAEPYPVYDAKMFNNALVLATANGIRFIDENGSSVMRTSASGLGSTGIASLAVVDNGMYAIAEDGSIAYISKEGNIESLNRAYEEARVTAVPGSVAVGGRFIVIAFKNKLAFFDTKSKAYLTSITKLGSTMLNATSLSCVLVSGDMLFVAAGNMVFSRKMDWENLNNDRFLLDPGSWTESHFSKPVLSMALVDGKLKTRSVAGSYYFKNGKEFSAAEDSSIVKINGVEIKNKDLYSNGVSRSKYILNIDNKTYLVGSNFVGIWESGSLKDLSSFPYYQLGGTYEMTSLSQGGMIVSGLNSKLAYFANNSFSTPVSSNDFGYSHVIDGPGHMIKGLSALPSGEVLYAIWGFGLVVFADYTFREVKFRVLSNDGTCIENYLTDYMVPISSTAAPDGTGFLVTYWSNKNYGIAYIDLYGDVYCASGAGSSIFSGTIVARMAKENNYEVFVSSNKAQSLNGSGSVDRFLLRSPKSGGELSIIEKTNLKTPDHGFVLDMAFGPNNVLWATTYSKIGYWESGDSIRIPHRISHFSGSAYSSIAVDSHDGLWIGSNGEGLYHLSKMKGSNDTLSARRFTTRDGLLNNKIYDLALDSINGFLWMAHNVGVSMLVNRDLRQAQSFMTDSSKYEMMVYPNPFRPKQHSKVVFQFVAENARINVFNAGGKLVKSFADNDLVGGSVEWDGRDVSGRLVAPGVYTYWVVVGGKKKKQGKLLIVH